MKQNINEELNYIKYLFGYEKGVVISEQRLLFEENNEWNPENAPLNTVYDIMFLQEQILDYEIYRAKTASYVEENDCTKALMQSGNMGSNFCKIKGSILCSDPNGCEQRKLMDGVYGPKTKAAHEKYKKNMPVVVGDVNADDRKSTFDLVGTGQNVPVTVDQIKSFQLFVWDSDKTSVKCDNNCVNQKGGGNCKYKTILCGGNCCLRKQAIDGAWGANTKKAWEQYKKSYLENFNFTSNYTFADVAKKLGYDINKL